MNRKLDTDTHVFFYEQDFYVLSNFSAFNLDWKGIRFQTLEHAYHFEKFLELPKSVVAGDIQIGIYNARSAHDAYKIAEENKSARRPDWHDVREPIMEEMTYAKASQHEYVLRKLLDTGDRVLVEDSWRDSFWGWGEDKNGANVLGKIWMKNRARFRAEGRL